LSVINPEESQSLKEKTKEKFFGDPKMSTTMSTPVTELICEIPILPAQPDLQTLKQIPTLPMALPRQQFSSKDFLARLTRN
jgi:hypothetical protein